MATERGNVDTLVSMSHKGVDITAAHGVVSTYMLLSYRSLSLQLLYMLV